MNRDQAIVLADRIAELFNKSDIRAFIHVEPIEHGHDQATISIKLGDSAGRVVDMLTQGSR